MSRIRNTVSNTIVDANEGGCHYILSEEITENFFSHGGEYYELFLTVGDTNSYKFRVTELTPMVLRRLADEIEKKVQRRVDCLVGRDGHYYPQTLKWSDEEGDGVHWNNRTKTFVPTVYSGMGQACVSSSKPEKD